MGEEKYGIWLTLLSFFTWFSSLEVGVGNSFRNRITKYFVSNDLTKVKSIISKGYAGMIVIYFFIILVLFLVSFILPFDLFFTTNGKEFLHFNIAFRVSVILYMLHFVFFFLNTILLATQYAKTTYLITALQNGILLLGILLFIYFNVFPSLLLIFIWFTSVPMIVWLVSSFLSFSTLFKRIKPNIKEVFNEMINPLREVDRNFFIIQFSTLIIFSTDNIIILNLFSGTEVSKYNIAFKYFNILMVIFNLVLVPYWASFTEAAHKKDKQWIVSHIKKLVFLWLAISFFSMFMIVLAPQAYQLWIGKELKVPFLLSLMMCISVLLTCWNNIFAYFLNAIARIKLQMRILLIGSFINLPLSIVLANKYSSVGVITATCITLLPLAIALPIQYNGIIKKMNIA